MRPSREERREYQQNAEDELCVAWLMAWRASRDLAIGLETRGQMKGLVQDAEAMSELIRTAEMIRRAVAKTGEGIEKLKGDSIKEARKHARQAFTLLSEAKHTQNDLVHHSSGNGFRNIVVCLRRCERAIENVGRAIELLGKC